MTCSAASVIREMLFTRYPQFNTLDTTRVDAIIEDAKLMVPCCKLGSRADLAVMYKAGSLLASSLSTSSTGSSSGGGIKRQKDGDVEIEYHASGLSSSSSSSGLSNDFETLYQQLVSGINRNSPRVLGYSG